VINSLALTIFLDFTFEILPEETFFSLLAWLFFFFSTSGEEVKDWVKGTKSSSELDKQSFGPLLDPFGSKLLILKLFNSK